jgi:hypothetical protein
VKRLNPKTMKPFKRGERRADGFTFVRYLVKRPIKADGFFVEDWKNPERKIYGKKRLNPDTQRPYEMGDYNSDRSLQFYQYVQNSSDKHGFNYESWLTPSKFQNILNKKNNYAKKHKTKVKKLVAAGSLKRRLNPDTGEEFKEGDTNADGKIFATYVSQEISNGFVGEYWVTDEQFLKRKISQSLRRAKDRAKQKDLDFNLTLDYLFKIFPKDYVCPVFETTMEWLGDKSNSPSIDRIIPDLGYVEGNVAFISGTANTLKLHRTPDVLRKIAAYVETHLEIEKVE